MGRSTAPKLTAARRKSVLHALEQGKTVTEAMAPLRLKRENFYAWMRKDSAFSEAVEAARMFHVEQTEQVLQDLLINGSDEPVYGGTPGDRKVIGHVKKFYPNVMLRFLERRHHDYKPREEVLNTNVNLEPIEGGVDMSSLSDSDQIELARLLGKASGPRSAEH